MTDKEKIKAEIERLILYVEEHWDCERESGAKSFASMLKDFIYSLPEETVEEYEAEINYWNQRGLSIRLDKSLKALGFKEGDIVKITIVKEEEL